MFGVKQVVETHSEGGSPSVLNCICIYSFFVLFSPSTAKNRKRVNLQKRVRDCSLILDYCWCFCPD